MGKAILFLILLAFFLNDVLYIYLQKSFFCFFLFEISMRLLIVGMIAWMLKRKIYSWSFLNLVKLDRKAFWVSSFALTLFGILIVHILGAQLQPFFKESSLFLFPFPPSLEMKLLDLVVSLTLVAISEELVFRGALMSYLQFFRLNHAIIILLSSSLFGLMHWGGGVHVIIVAFLWGLVSGAYVLKYRSIYPVIISHYVTNFIVFCNLYFIQP